MTVDWESLAAGHPRGLVDRLQKEYDSGSISFTASGLVIAASSDEETFTDEQALALLRDVGPWLEEGTKEVAPDEDFPDEDPETIPVFTWTGEPHRPLGWLLLIHGMNTKGDWQQDFAFDVGRWRGTAVPTFIHKYGRIIVGVILWFRRAKFKKGLRNRILELAPLAEEQRLPARPDVVAHSFGTWMLGHVLLDEMKRTNPQIAIGRVILTGSILRPDFPWEELQRADLVEDVLNHYATNDPVVPWAHWTIWNSGPSGKRGFDPPQSPCEGREVLNVRTAPKGHSGATSDSERYGNYGEVWTPFLTDPEGQASRRLEVEDPKRSWRQAWWPLRGSIFPLIVVPLLLVSLSWGFLKLGPSLTSWRDSAGSFFASAAWILGIAAGVLFALYLLQKIWCWISRRWAAADA